MMRLILPSRTSALLRAIRRSNSGVAMMEFAFSLPILLVLLLGGVEIANFVMTHMRVNQIAMTVADNAGRVRTGIDESQIYEVFSGADVVGQSINFKENGRIVLSSLQPNGKTDGNAGQMINWQRCHGDLAVNPSYGLQDAGRNDATMATGMGRTGNRIVAAENTAVMFVEVTYQYTPIFTDRVMGPTRIRYESAFNVRERTNQNITNTQSLARNNC